MPLTNTEMADKLSSLVQSDAEAVRAYGQILSIMDKGSLKNQLLRFQRDHERHVDQLSAVIRALDSEPPKSAFNSEGQSTKGLTSDLKPAECEKILYSMKANEELINNLYRKSSVLDFSPNIKGLVERNCDDEELHLRYITEVLASRLWEK